MSGAVNIFAPDWQRAESYGRVALELARELEKLGLVVNRIGRNAPSQHPIALAMGGLLLGYPTNITAYGTLAQHGPRIAVTMFESTQIPPGWRDVLNTLDAVIVPSDFCAGVFRDCGVKTPIHVQPLGISRAFRPVPRPTDRTPYTFLALGDRGMRKGWHIAGQAFMRAFGDDLNYRLIYKARPHSLERLRGFTNPNIELRRADLPDTKLAALYAETDCFLFPSSGEGQGLPPLEYAATAGPVIATHWGGMADHLPQWGYPINYTLKPAWGSDPVMGGLGMWAEPDIDDLAATMTFVASHRTWALERAAEAATFVRRHYTWRKFARKVFAVWQEVTEHGKRSVWAAVPYRTG